jgi:hypothetical protein
VTDQSAPFQQLDFVYTPSRDVAGDLGYFSEVLGGRVVFAVEAMGTRVAAVQFTEGPPLVLLADHVEGDRPILVYRVADLGAALVALAARGWERQQSLEIPQGPCCSYRTPGGYRIALYQLTRAEVASHFEGAATSNGRSAWPLPGLIEARRDGGTAAVRLILGGMVRLPPARWDQVAQAVPDVSGRWLVTAAQGPSMRAWPGHALWAGQKLRRGR